MKRPIQNYKRSNWSNKKLRSWICKRNYELNKKPDDVDFTKEIINLIQENNDPTFIKEIIDLTKNNDPEFLKEIIDLRIYDRDVKFVKESIDLTRKRRKRKATHPVKKRKKKTKKNK